MCDPHRASRHQVFEGQAGWGHSSVKWYFGSKLHLIIKDKGELLAVALPPDNTDDRKPVPEITQELFGKLFGDKGYYLSSPLWEAP